MKIGKSIFALGSHGIEERKRERGWRAREGERKGCHFLERRKKKKKEREGEEEEGFENPRYVLSIGVLNI